MPSALPLIYHPDYDIPEWNEEHRFPMSKFRRLYKIISEEKNLSPVEFHQPEVASTDHLQAVHTLDYIQQFMENRLNKSAARRIGLPWTEGLARRTITAVGGTILTLQLALKHGLACNLAGGTHHAFPDLVQAFAFLTMPL